MVPEVDTYDRRKKAYHSRKITKNQIQHANTAHMLIPIPHLLTIKKNKR